jgi:hypothetical protein
MNIEAHGIKADLPPGWEGRISRRSPGATVGTRGATGTALLGEQTAPILHMANFALPEDRGDFGSGAVDLMGAGHLLVVLVEYGPDSVDTALFPRVTSVPRLTARMYSSQALQRVQRGQAGAQRFFTLDGRAFCLYSVLGDQRDAGALVPTVNSVTATIEVTPR